MKHLLFFLGVMIGVSGHTVSQTPLYNVQWTTAGRVNLAQTNYGICGFDVAKSRGGLLYPRTDGLQYLFASGMWFGGFARVGDELRARVLLTYDVNSGTGCAVPGELKNGRQARPDLANEYQVKRRIEDGIEVLSSRYHLGDTTRYQGADRSRIPGLSDIDVREWTYAFDNEQMADIIIRRFEFINTGLDTVYTFVPAWVLDADVGDPSNPQQAGRSDLHRVEQVDPNVFFYIAHDNDESTTGELGFAVLESPQNVHVRTITDGQSFISKTEHYDRFEAMTSGERLATLGPSDVAALYASERIDVFAPGDTLRYTTAFVLMPSAERKARVSAGNDALTLYYVNALQNIRTWLADLPTGVEEEPTSGAAVSVIPHPITDQWTLRAPTSTTWDVSIYALDGQLIHRFTTATDGTAHGPALASGVYHVVMTNDNERHTRVVVRTP